MKINTKRNTDRSLVTLCKLCRKSTISQQLNHRLLRKLTRCTFLWLVYVLCIVYTRLQKRWLLNNMFRERWYPKTLWEMLHNFHDSWQTSVHDNCFLSGKWVWLPSYTTCKTMSFMFLCTHKAFGSHHWLSFKCQRLCNRVYSKKGPQ